jgi:hypothetical protein
MEKVGGKPFVVVYFNAEAPLAAIPDTLWFSELHAALCGGHRDQLCTIYAVHPTALLKFWLWVLRQGEPEVYSKVGAERGSE